MDAVITENYKRVIVCGSRNWTDESIIDTVFKTIVHEDVNYRYIFVHGACKTGADAICEKLKKGFTEIHPANWSLHGKAAGPMRNEKMATLGAYLCIAFWDGISTGTLNMIRESEKEKIPVVMVLPSGIVHFQNITFQSIKQLSISNIFLKYQGWIIK